MQLAVYRIFVNDCNSTVAQYLAALTSRNKGAN